MCKLCTKASEVQSEDEKDRLRGDSFSLRESDPAACSICLSVVNEDAGSREARAQWRGNGCTGHAFHKEHLISVLETAFKTKPDVQCPMCRTDIEWIEHTRTGEQLTCEFLFEKMIEKNPGLLQELYEEGDSDFSDEDEDYYEWDDDELVPVEIEIGGVNLALEFRVRDFVMLQMMQPEEQEEVLRQLIAEYLMSEANPDIELNIE